MHPPEKVSTFNIEMIEQSLALRRVMFPGDAFDASARFTAFAPVKNDAAIFFGKT